MLPYEYSTIDYLKTIIENKEIEYRNKKQDAINKLFIFLVHLERVDKKDLEKPNNENVKSIRQKILVSTLSNLAGYHQIFIEDINGQDYYDNEGKIISLEKILNMKNNDLYKVFLNEETIIISFFFFI